MIVLVVVAAVATLPASHPDGAIDEGSTRGINVADVPITYRDQSITPADVEAYRARGKANFVVYEATDDHVRAWAFDTEHERDAFNAAKPVSNSP